MLKIFLILSCLIFAYQTTITKYINGSSSVTSKSVAVDKNGYIYVAGDTYGNLNGVTIKGATDGFLLKYDSDGNLLFTNLIGSTGSEILGGIAVDQNGNVFVTGNSGGNLYGETNNGGDDCFLIKYDTNGSKQWTRLIGSINADGCNSIAIDQNGYVFVAGKAYQTVNGETHYGDKDGLLLKFDFNGNLQWTKLIGSSSSEEIYGVAVDRNGNVFVTGNSAGNLNGETNNGGDDCFLIKYDTNGNYKWTRLIGSSSSDGYSSVATDQNGNIYVTGKTRGILNGEINKGMFDCFLVKYDTNGNLKWTKLSGSTSNEDCRSISVDQNDNVFVTGYVKASNPNGSFLLKYDLDGNLIWTRPELIPNNNAYISITVDNFVRFFYVTGITKESGIFKSFLIKEKICDFSCKNCIGGLTNDCTRCSDNYHIISTSNFPTECYNTAPDGYYLYINIYRKCDISCKNCIGISTNCTRCSDNYHKISTSIFPTKCYNTPPEGYYFNIISNTYNICHSPCNDCVDTPNKCISCIINYYFDPEINNKCIDNAPNGYFINNLKKKIEKCDESCKNCLNSSDYCIECSENYYSLYNNKNKCVLSCPSCR